VIFKNEYHHTRRGRGGDELINHINKITLACTRMQKILLRKQGPHQRMAIMRFETGKRAAPQA